MPARVPLKIFRLVQTKNGTFDLAPTQYAQGVTTSNIVTNPDGTRVINVADTQLTTTATLAEVKTDVGGDYFLLGSNKLYIANSAIGQTKNTDSSVFEFYVNPQRLTPTYQKIQTEIRTRGGWEVQHWGNNLTELTVEGHSGGMHQVTQDRHIIRTVTDAKNNVITTMGLNPTNDITDSTAWKRLMQLKRLYDIDHSVRNQEQLTLLGLAIYNSFYVGYFTQFTGPTQEADKPYMFSYQFTMKILQETTVSALSPTIINVANAGIVTAQDVGFGAQLR